MIENASNSVTRSLRREAAHQGQVVIRSAWRLFQRGFRVHQKEWQPERTFTQFLSLPAEIRERIYEICCDNDRLILREHFATSRPPPEPAIACSSKQLRAEALPVFYRHYRFPVATSPSTLINDGALPPGQEWRAARWYHRLDPAKLRMIRRLELYYCFGHFNVDFDIRTNAYTVEQTAMGSHRMVDIPPVEERAIVLSLVADRVDEILAASGIDTLTARDFDRLEMDVGVERECWRKV